MGGLLRLNLSKSGLGVSVGPTGLRLGVKPDGKAYVSGGRHGLYFRKSLTSPASSEYGTPQEAGHVVPVYEALDRIIGILTGQPGDIEVERKKLGDALKRLTPNESALFWKKFESLGNPESRRLVRQQIELALEGRKPPAPTGPVFDGSSLRHKSDLNDPRFPEGVALVERTGPYASKRALVDSLKSGLSIGFSRAWIMADAILLKAAKEAGPLRDKLADVLKAEVSASAD